MGQIWALVRRYCILLRRTPIRSAIRLLLWPVSLIVLVVYLLMSLSNNSDSFSKTIFISLTPVFLTLITLFHIYSFAEMLIKDKASGMKSLMLSMGLERTNYYCAASLCFQSFTVPVVLVSTIILKVYLFDTTLSILTYFTVLVLFALHLEAFMFFLVSFISAPAYTFVVPLLIFFERILTDNLAKYVLQQVNDYNLWKPIVLFLISISPYEPIRMFIDGYLSNLPDTSETRLTQDNSIIILEQIFWIVVLKMFAIWFEEVCPWQKVSAVQGPLFCFSRQNNRYSNSDREVKEPTGTYFEQIDIRNREAGIKVYDLKKSFGGVPALNDLSFTIYKGETTFLLGHNGAGKSTLINIILGLLLPDTGYVRIKASSSSNRSSIGVCPQTSVLDDGLSVKQHLELFNDIKSDIIGDERRRHIEKTLIDVNLREHKDKLPEELSGGMRRKLSLGMAFIGKSEVLLLDEPSSGLDPDSRMFTWDVIRRYRADKTVLLSTQHMEEADYLGDRIAIMSAGRLICCGSSVFLKNIFGASYKLRIECKPGKRDRIIAHIRKFFDRAHLLSDSVDTNDSEANAGDFVVELKNKNGNFESTMIKLLEDLENNAESLGVCSYGLKSSSIEDVMLHTSKYLGQEATTDNTSTRLMVSSTGDHLETLAKSRKKSAIHTKSQTACRVISALVEKQLQIYHANWISILVIKVALPVLGAYNIISEMDGHLSLASYWQSPVPVLLVGHFVYFPARERVSKFRIMQLESDATIWLYWFAQFLIDMLAVVLVLVFINIFLLTSFNATLKISVTEFHLLVSFATLMLCMASLPFCYLLSTALKDPKTSIGTVWIIFFSSSVIYMVIMLLRMAIFKSGQKWIQDLASYISVIFLPGDAYRLFFVGLTNDCYIVPRLSTECQSSGAVISPVLLGLAVLALQMFGYGFLLALVECQKLDLGWCLELRHWFGWFCYYCVKKQTIHEPSVNDVDDDVIKEAERAVMGIGDPSNRAQSLVAAKLEKSFAGKKYIKSLSFGVNRGECFGLLGVNGAGKSTTFSMLVGEVRPDSGRILAHGRYLDRDTQQYRRLFGYDPQSDPELSLTPNQALKLMARLRGVEERNIPSLVNSVLELLSMSQHAHKLDSELSGGTRRKLTLGMAIIGNPSILALDEPTAGVDPLARRGIWRLLKSMRLRNEASIVVASHAMEECEAICDRISIMSQGQLRCIGTFLHLRSKFARGCSLRVQFSKQSADLSAAGSSDETINELTRSLSDTIGSTTFKLVDQNINSLTYEVLDNRIRRSLLFRAMHEFRKSHPNVTYMINDSSLEDIFVHLARQEVSK